jgi:hypothetical protein
VIAITKRSIVIAGTIRAARQPSREPKFLAVPLATAVINAVLHGTSPSGNGLFRCTELATGYMRAGIGLNHHSNDFLAGVGFAARY